MNDATYQDVVRRVLHGQDQADHQSTDAGQLTQLRQHLADLKTAVDMQERRLTTSIETIERQRALLAIKDDTIKSQKRSIESQNGLIESLCRLLEINQPHLPPSMRLSEGVLDKFKGK